MSVMEATAYTSVWELVGRATVDDHLWLARAMMSDKVDVSNVSFNGAELPGPHPIPFRSLRDALEFVQFAITALMDERIPSDRDRQVEHSMELVGAALHWRVRGVGLDTFFNIYPTLN